jgi:hypothetical protein
MPEFLRRINAVKLQLMVDREHTIPESHSLPSISYTSDNPGKDTIEIYKGLTAFSNRLGHIVSLVIWPSVDKFDEESTVIHINLPSIG